MIRDRVDQPPRCSHCRRRIQDTNDNRCPRCGAKRNPYREATLYLTDDPDHALRGWDDRPIVAKSHEAEIRRGVDNRTQFMLDPTTVEWPD